jgi:hypothetical protein
VIDKLKQCLWECYGHPDFRAEWDGRIFGGGKVSQRYWEYLITINFLGLDEKSVLLDIGGGNGFFANLVMPFRKQVIVIDPSVSDKLVWRIKKIKELANSRTLKYAFKDYPEITHVSCISVLEHCTDQQREDLAKGLNDNFWGDTIVFTFEYHPLMVFKDTFLTMKSMSQMFSKFTNFYMTNFTACPTRAINSYSELQGEDDAIGAIPNWYPVAVRMKRCS